MKFFLLALCIVISLMTSAQSILRVSGDTLKIERGELEIQNSSKNINGFLFNLADGKTAFKRLGRNIQFVAGAPTFPKAGDSIYVNPDLMSQAIKVWRNGLLQYRDIRDGVGIDTLTGKIIFRPALVNGDRIFIESINALEVTASDNTTGGFTGGKVADKLYAGAFDNKDNTYWLRWNTNARSLFLAPKVVGIGSSTLAGYGLSFPDRMGDKINAWLTNNTSGSVWLNLAVAGYTSANVLPTANGGIAGTNIDSALNANPDFIFLSLASNDAAAGITVNQSILNYKKIDSIAQSRGVPVFFSTTQPRTSYNGAQQTLLKQLGDSIRIIWPDRYVEAFRDVVDVNAATDAVIQSQYDNGDGTHLNSKGNQFIVDHLFERWADYFQFRKGIKRYVVDTSADQSNWVPFDNITDKDLVKKMYLRANKLALYFRVKAEKNDGTFSDYSNIAKLGEVIVPPLPQVFDHRILVDLGGDGVYTLNGSSQKDGQPTPSPDAQGKIWNNWFGKGGVIGFVDSASITYLKTAAGDNTAISMMMLGTPDNGFSTVATKSINYTGFKVDCSDYPKEALYDNVFFYYTGNSKPATLRIKGLARNNAYYIKLWGARIDDASTAPRTLEVKLGTADWLAAQTVNTRYGSSTLPDYNRAITFTNITGVDSVDLNIRVGAGSTFAHLSLIDIGIVGAIPPMPKITMPDVTTTSKNVSIVPTVATAGYTISSYQWSRLSGPNAAVITSPTSVNTTITGLTNGTFVFRLSAATTVGLLVTGDVKVDVYPDNEGKKTMRVYFSNTKAKPIPGWLNAFGPVTGAFLSYTDPITNWTIDNAGAANTFWSPLYNLNASDDMGTVTGNNSGIIPDIALQGNWFNYSTPYLAGRDNIIISGLDPSKSYKLRLVPSRSNGGSTTAPRYGVYHVNGGPELVADAFMATANKVDVDNVIPDASGKIKIAVYQAAAPNTYGAVSYLNGLILQEN